MHATQTQINTLYERFLISGLFGNRLFIARERLNPRLSSHYHSLEASNDAARHHNASEQAITTHIALIKTLMVICQEHSEAVEDVATFRKALIKEQGILTSGEPCVVDLARLEKWIEEIRVDMGRDPTYSGTGASRRVPLSNIFYLFIFRPNCSLEK